MIALVGHCVETEKSQEATNFYEKIFQLMIFETLQSILSKMIFEALQSIKSKMTLSNLKSYRNLSESRINILKRVRINVTVQIILTLFTCE